MFHYYWNHFCTFQTPLAGRFYLFHSKPSLEAHILDRRNTI